ncbi:MAG: hypothetical protein H0X07_01585 [Gemmatimonadales bacterium]|nr:hypothetical protein [Gemmatimonadales bacterium]
MKWTRRFFSLGLVFALLAGVSCTAVDSALTGVTDSQPLQASPLLGSTLDGPSSTLDQTVNGLGSGDLGGAIGGVFEVTNLLTCTMQPYVAVTQTVGPNGGKIKVGEHVLEIPQGALSSDVKITAEQVPGATNSLRFSPEGLRFGRPAALTMSYQNCAAVLLPKAIVYTTEKLQILEVLLSLDLFRKQTVSAPIDHFSRYAVAY